VLTFKGGYNKEATPCSNYYANEKSKPDGFKELGAEL
jgi:hypothetical protein